MALFIKTDTNVRTSKHSGVISIFDKEFVHTGKLDPYYSKILHRVFKARQEGDYKELVELSLENAIELVKLAEEFLYGIKNLIAPIS